MPTRQLGPCVMNRALKDPVMIRAGSGRDVIARRLGRARLKKLLQLAFRVFKRRDVRQLAKGIPELAENKPPSGFEPSVEKNSAKQGFERISQGGQALAASRNLLASADDQVLAKPQLSGLLREAATIHQLGARFGQRPFSKSGKFLV